MLCVQHFKQTDPQRWLDFIRRYPLATVVAAGQGSTALPAISHVPFVFEGVCDEQGLDGVLLGHVARNDPLFLSQFPSVSEQQNQHQRQHQSLSPVICTSVFQAENAYVSPDWYPSKARGGKVVPTWNFIALHVHGEMQWVQDADEILEILEKQTLAYEQSVLGVDGKPISPPYWRVADAPADYTQRLVRAIVGVKIKINAVDAKWKLSQNKTQEDRAGIVAGLRAQKNAQAEQAADWMEAWSE